MVFIVSYLDVYDVQSSAYSAACSVCGWQVTAVCACNQQVTARELTELTTRTRNNLLESILIDLLSEPIRIYSVWRIENQRCSIRLWSCRPVASHYTAHNSSDHERKQVLQQEAYPHMAPCWRPKLGHSWGYPPNRRRPVWDVAEPPCKISRRSIKRRLRNL